MVRGTIDCLVRRPDGGVSVLEFKTGARRPEHLEQLNLYRRAATLLFPGAQVDEHLVYTRVGTQ
jgi:ATP-dependent exoDNAse (exonuclease V) beta subunit